MIYPLECNTSKSGISVGKSEGNLQSFLNNHRKNVEDLKAIEANKHSIWPGYNFKMNAKFFLLSN